MRVAIKLYSEMKRFAPGDTNEFSLELPSGATVAQVFDALGIDDYIPRFVLVDGMLRNEPEFPLADGCTIVMFPPVSGG